MHKKRGKINFILVAAILLVAGGILAFSVWALSRTDETGGPAPANSSQPETGSATPSAVSSLPASGSAPMAENEADPAAAILPEELRAMWISFLEWEKLDISTEAAMRSTAASMFDNCTAMGLNTVIVAVRSFSDALYPSEVYPWSHLITGTQGQDPGYDPLAVLVEEAHARGLRIEAWVNPYRVDGASGGPETLSADSPAAQHPEWVREINGVWFDPGLPEVQQLVAGGIREIAQNYDVDGIHLDDYFYPEFNAEQREAGEDEAFDADTFARYGGGNALGAWRRENVNAMVKLAHDAVKAAKPNVSFGISPQGNNENNYNIQYSDVKLWMAQPGYVDYVMPQLYWGFGYLTASGRDNYAFENIAREWAGYDRVDSVRLYAGLGAYRIGVGDGGAGDQAEWQSGHNLADMVTLLRTLPEYSGFALFRYEFLFMNEDPLGAQEAAALTALLPPEPAEAAGSSSVAAEAVSGAAPSAPAAESTASAP